METRTQLAVNGGMVVRSGVQSPTGQQSTLVDRAGNPIVGGTDYIYIPPFITFATPRNMVRTMHLEELRDGLVRWSRDYAPRDIERSPNQYHVGFNPEGRMMIGPLDPITRSVNTSSAMLFTKTGLAQLGYEVLPSRGLAVLRDLAAIRLARQEGMSEGSMLAMGAWNTFMHDPKNYDLRKPLKFRTIELPEGPVVYSVVSQSYTPFDDLVVIEQLLKIQTIRNMFVLWCRRTTDGMFIRLAMEQPVLDKPIKMVELWNSGSARSSLGLRGGMFRLKCTNGAFSWDDKSEYSWNHVGDPYRIHRGLRDAMTNIDVAASGVIREYTEALSMQIEDMFEYMNQVFAAGPKDLRLTEDQLKATKDALHDPTTTPGYTVASLLDAGTLAAQKETDDFDQRDMELKVSRAFARAMATARENRGYVPVRRSPARSSMMA